MFGNNTVNLLQKCIIEKLYLHFTFFILNLIVFYFIHLFDQLMCVCDTFCVLYYECVIFGDIPWFLDFKPFVLNVFHW